MPERRQAARGDVVHAALKTAVEVTTNRHLWTPSDAVDFVPAVASTIFGDGRALLALTTINDRPRFYVIRIDSTWEVGESEAQGIWDHLDAVYNALEAEFGRARDEEENRDSGWPAFDGETGTSWSRMRWPALPGLSFEPHPFCRHMNILPLTMVDPVRRIEFRYLDLPEVLPRARRMSFFLTTAQVLARTKTVTRRAVHTWAALKAGDNLIAIEKGQGLKAGEGHKVLALLEVVDVRVEPLDAITAEDCAREGFPAMTPAEFCEFFRRQA